MYSFFFWRISCLDTGQDSSKKKVPEKTRLKHTKQSSEESRTHVVPGTTVLRIHVIKHRIVGFIRPHDFQQPLWVTFHLRRRLQRKVLSCVCIFLLYLVKSLDLVRIQTNTSRFDGSAIPLLFPVLLSVDVSAGKSSMAFCTTLPPSALKDCLPLPGWSSKFPVFSKRHTKTSIPFDEIGHFYAFILFSVRNVGKFYLDLVKKASCRLCMTDPFPGRYFIATLICIKTSRSDVWVPSFG